MLLILSTLFAEGVIKVDPSGLEGRKGISISTAAGDTKLQSLNVYATKLNVPFLCCSIRLPCLCLPLWKRGLGRHGSVLQERHLDPARSGVSSCRRKHSQNTNVGIPHEKSGRARIPLHLPGEKQNTQLTHSSYDK